MAIGRSAPLSVDEILAAQKAERDAASKPKFMTKQERAKLALERRQQELQDQQKRQQEEREERERFERQAEEERRQQQFAERQQHAFANRFGPQGGPHGRFAPSQPPRPNNPAYSGSKVPPAAPRGPAAQRNGGIPTGPRAAAPSQSVAGSSSYSSASSLRTSGGDTAADDSSFAAPTEAELAVIRSRYLGAQSGANGGKKPRARKLQDKKFVFDWDETDDTTQGAVGNLRESVVAGTGGGMTDGVMFGGRLAGYDETIRATGSGNNQASGAGATHAGTHTDAFERRRAGKGRTDERHWTEKPLQDMKDRDWRIFREDFSIAARGGSIPHPMRSWDESGIPPAILDIIAEIGYKEPSPIQRQAIPIGLQNRDLIGIAQTGSGKTAAFVIPMLEYISHLPALNDDNRHLGPYALILAPTRELAQQIETETKRFSGPLGYNTVSIVGGRSVEEQQFNLRDGAQIVIATPGRLKDMIDRNILVLSQCRYVVMDEADRMVDLGFEQELTFILNAMAVDYEKPEGMEVDDVNAKGWKGYRVTTLFSATMPPIVERLAKKYLRRPATVVIGNAGEAVDTVEQRVEFIQGPEKRKTRLIEILRTIGLPSPMIVFCNEKQTVDQVVSHVRQAGKRAVTLHSGKNQEQREASLQSLRDGEVDVLVATDLAGRGIDVPDVTCVINWQMASTIEKYVHRIGRTGRAGKQGIAITFLGNEDEETMYDLKQGELPCLSGAIALQLPNDDRFFAEISKSPISTMNPELARHPAARQRVTREMKRKRDDDE